MAEVDRHLLASNVGLLLPRTTGRSMQLDPTGSSVLVGGVAFRDDFALPSIAEDNSLLLQKLVQAADIVAAVHADFHLKVDWSPGKTEATIRLTSASAKGLYAGLRRIGAAAKLRQPALKLANDLVLAICDVYPYLGRLHHQGLKLSKEVQARIVKAAAANRDKSKALTSKSFTPKVRLQLMRNYVTCHLTQNLCVSPCLAPGPNDDLVTIIACAQRTIRLSARRLLITDTSALQALLAANRSVHSVWSGMVTSLQRLYKCGISELSAFPSPSVDTLHIWVEFVLLHLDSWKTIVYRIKSTDPPKCQSKRRDTEPVREPDLAGTDVDAGQTGVGVPHPEQLAGPGLPDEGAPAGVPPH
eukprot:4707256-Amphidinium_carterae.1